MEPDRGSVGRLCLDSLVFDDGLLAAVVTALAANGVVDVPCTAVGAKSQSGSNCLVVCTTLCSAGLGLLAFRMCHCFLFYGFLFYVIVFFGKFP